MNDNDILLKEVSEALKGMQAPRVDVAAKVMVNLPDLAVQPQVHRLRLVKRISIAAAACLLLAVAVNLSLFFVHTYDESVAGDATVMVYDYHTYSGDYAVYESAVYLDMNTEE